MGERVLAAALLVLLLPLITAAAIATAILSRRSPLIAHERVGQGGRPIWVLKIRSMWDRNSPAPRAMSVVERLAPQCKCAIEIKNAKDPRITSRFAGFCRRYSIDELPQLWHVVRGEMALIGPRPLTAHEIETHYNSATTQILRVKPGLSGLWQIAGRSRLSYGKRRRLDLFMIRNWSLQLYLAILIRTIPAVLVGKDAW